MKRPMSREELEELVRNHQPVARTSIRRVFGGPVSESGELFGKDAIEFESQDGLESLEFFASGSCDFGHLLGTQGTEIAGRCTICGKWLCTQEGCMHTCHKGHAVCGRHAIINDDGVYCTQHRPFPTWVKPVAQGTAKACVGLVRVACKVLRSWWGF